MNVVFKNYLKTNEKIPKIWNLITSSNFKKSIQWRLLFFYSIDEQLIHNEHPDQILDTINQIIEDTKIYFNDLKKFTQIKTELFGKILRIIIDKIEKEKLRIFLDFDFFDKFNDLLGDDIELIKKAYLLQDNINDHFDLDGKEFLTIIGKARSFLTEYVEHLYVDSERIRAHNLRNLSVIWKIDGIENELFAVVDIIIEKEKYYFGILEHFFNAFFYNSIVSSFRDVRPP